MVDTGMRPDIGVQAVLWNPDCPRTCSLVCSAPGSVSTLRRVGPPPAMAAWPVGPRTNSRSSSFRSENKGLGIVGLPRPEWWHLASTGVRLGRPGSDRPPAPPQALGCILYLLCFRQHPFEDGAKLRIVNGKYVIPPDDTRYSVFHGLIRKSRAPVLGARLPAHPGSPVGIRPLSGWLR